MAIKNQTEPGRSAPIAGTPRKKDAGVDMVLVTIYAEDGTPVTKPRGVANDYVRFRGYSFTSTAPAPGTADEGEGEDGEGEDGEDAGTSTLTAAEEAELERSEAELAMAHMESLRETASKLGIGVDNRWGKVRLNAEIAKAIAAIAAIRGDSGLSQSTG